MELLVVGVNGAGSKQGTADSAIVDAVVGHRQHVSSGSADIAGISGLSVRSKCTSSSE